MKQPLIKRDNAHSHFFHGLIFTLVFFILLSFSLQHFTNPADAKLGTPNEEAVSATFGESAHKYFALGHLSNKMKLYESFKGPDTMLKLLCPPTTPTCKSICEKRAEPVQPKSKLPKEPEECFHVNEKEVRECLITYTMRCWRAGASVYDGSHEWTLVFHEERSEDDPKMVPWIHLTSHDTREDAFFFGWNDNESGENPCEKFSESSKLLHKLEVARNDFAILLGGHGSGALWAHCANLRLAESGRPPELRKVVNTGMPLLTNEFVNHYLVTVEPGKTILNLVVASTFQEIGQLVDLEPILKAPAGFRTFPAFGYSCSSNFEMRLQSLACMDPQPEVNIDNSVRNTLLPKVPVDVKGKIIRTLHSFSMYQSCFRACRQQFQRDGVDLQNINVLEYEKQEEVMEVEDSGETSANTPPDLPPGLTELERGPPRSSGSMLFYDRTRDPRLQQQERGAIQSQQGGSSYDRGRDPRLQQREGAAVQLQQEASNLSTMYSPQPGQAQSSAEGFDDGTKPEPIAEHLRNSMD